MEARNMNMREMLDLAFSAPNMDRINFHNLHKTLKSIIELLEIDEVELNEVDTSDAGSSNTKSEEEKEDLNVHTESAEPSMETQETQTEMISSGKREEKLMKPSEKALPKNSNPVGINQKLVSLESFVRTSVQKLQDDVAVLREGHESTRINDINDVVAAAKGEALRGKDEEQSDLVSELNLLEVKTDKLEKMHSELSSEIRKILKSSRDLDSAYAAKIDSVLDAIEKERKVWHSNYESLENCMNDKVDRFEMDCIKKYVRNKVQELNKRKEKSMKNALRATEEGEPNETCCTRAEGSCHESVERVLTQCAEALNVGRSSLDNCLCTFVRGTNGAVYRGECRCDAQKEFLWTSGTIGRTRATAWNLHW